MLMWLEPGPRPRGGRRWAETWSWHREERAPFAQLFTSFSHELLGLEEVSEMIWSDLFHCNDEETAQRDLSNLLKSTHKNDRAGVKTCVPWVIAQLRPLRAKCADFWTSRNVPECVRVGPFGMILVVLSHTPKWFGDGEINLSDEGRHGVSAHSMSAFLSRLWSGPLHVFFPPSGYKDVDGESLLFELSKLIQIDIIMLLKIDNIFYVQRSRWHFIAIGMCLPLALVLYLVLKAELIPPPLGICSLVGEAGRIHV